MNDVLDLGGDMSGFAEISIVAEYHPEQNMFDVGYSQIFYLVCIESWLGSVVIGVFPNKEEAAAFQEGLIQHMHLIQAYIETNYKIVEKITSDIVFMRRQKYYYDYLQNKHNQGSIETRSALEKERNHVFKKFTAYIEANKLIWETLKANMGEADNMDRDAPAM